jgi:hypothetical protein
MGNFTTRSRHRMEGDTIMWLRLRQICLVAHDIEEVTDALGAIFNLDVCFIDPNVGKYGLENRLYPIGNQFLEVVSPTQPGTAAGRYLERRSGDGGYMVITQCNDHEPVKRRIGELGVRVANAIEHDGFHGLQLHPKDTGGAFFEIDLQDGGEAPDGPWTPAGTQWKNHVRTDIISAITCAELQSPKPIELAQKWSEIANLPLERPSPDVAEIVLENARLRFVPECDDRGEGLAGLDVRAVHAPTALAAAARRGCPVNGNTVTICGTRFRLV